MIDLAELEQVATSPGRSAVIGKAWLRQAEMHDKEVRIIQNMIRVQMSKIRLRYMRAALAEAAERKRRNEAARVIQGMKRKVAARATIALLREALKERKKMEALALQVRK